MEQQTEDKAALPKTWGQLFQECIDYTGDKQAAFIVVKPDGLCLVGGHPGTKKAIQQALQLILERNTELANKSRIVSPTGAKPNGNRIIL